MKVPFVDLVAQNHALRDRLLEAIGRIESNAQFILGPAVERFESEFADYLGVSHCIGVDNGTSALHLVLRGMDIGPGDEVITTPLTWVSTAWAISYVGATPVFVDVDPVTFTLAPTKVAAAMTPRTRAILAVHLYGQAAALEALSEIAARHNVPLVEDAAQAHGASLGGKRVGGHGRAGCFSFYPGKNLGAWGDAGAVVTNDARLAERVRRLRNHSQETRHCHLELGFNSRLDAIQAAILAEKLPYLDGWNSRRAQHARTYAQLLAGIPGLELPASPPEGQHVWHQYVVLVRDLERGSFRARLGESGIESGVHYPVLVPFQPAYAHLGACPGDFPVADDIATHCVSLPISAELSDEQITRVSDVVRSVCTMLARSPVQEPTLEGATP